MQEILKNIYKEHSNKKQRKMIQKSLENQLYINARPRRKMSFKHSYDVSTPMTSHSIDKQTDFQKDINLFIPKNPQRKNYKENLSSEKNIVLPKLAKVFSSRGYYLRKFRAAVFAVMFTKRLQNKVEENLIKLRKKAQKISMNLLKYIDQMVKQYYYDLLSNQMQNYLQLLKEIMQDNQPIDGEQIIELVYNFSIKLSSSTVTQKILDFFIYTATNKGYPPCDYLSYPQISRLQFSSKYGYIDNVSNQQTRMMIALGLGIKIFCYYIICQPFHFENEEDQKIQIDQRVQKFIGNVNSIFYYIIMEQFCLKNRQNKLKNLKIMQKFKIGVLKSLNPFRLTINIKKTCQNSLFVGMNRNFYFEMQQKYAVKMKKIKGNIEKWINRITCVCLKHAQNNKNIGLNSTINSISRDSRSPFKKAFRSVQMYKDRQKGKIKNQRYNFY